MISLLVSERKKGIEYKKSTKPSKDLSHQFYFKAIFMFTSERRNERKLLFGPDQQYFGPARLNSCIGINVLHNQNIHPDKRNRIAEIWNYSYRNVVPTTNTLPLVDDNVFSVHCTVHPKILEIYTWMHAPCIFLAHSWLTTVVFKISNVLIWSCEVPRLKISHEREAKIADLSTFLSLVVVGSILVSESKIQLSF